MDCEVSSFYETPFLGWDNDDFVVVFAVCGVECGAFDNGRFWVKRVVPANIW